MKQTYSTELGFAHAVRYNDAMILAWATRTGHTSRSGWMSYKPEEVPSYIDQPTNEERSRAEVIEFLQHPLPYGEVRRAYYTMARTEHTQQCQNLCGERWRGVISTYAGGLLAVVLSEATNTRMVFGRENGFGGTYRAIGIDGRQYYGRHNGKGMSCTMRLAMYQEDFDIQQRTKEGWETVSSEKTLRLAAAAVREYRNNQPQLPVRFRRVRQSQIAK